ncbi:MAG: hypothetical protein A2268_15785 [Candidatus Raymondbacteria bacterium RifOxyA12_full_50_37]|uniref:Hcy-binding domain-containing protein n=1 Tax=Candidatus Raymondbacteria bacterium RIFOXYD12_FULL_49_13 TaxID=1817890 RepID=A0A1F7FJA0_UNCRA|nr:MAG: hypothetical protein A2268_15785 [Candidatus Raymondbacteria bacterium RifOxyA12_full_50_37]OGJ87702.1 MAG: hypothetical protein A2248_07490 [Candidatus Raymondbacteria bacterium RIFOXYA2_FULL_49_16]OGJ90321.1 MAG: hypothetical protein A2350_00260 [Candidatus Raymondbacteria bacterium RifOxyB12_full_50_8]OGJ96505.1 MAG: hypothetical protein A2453_00110 [Candidatus Raymondbacteria bacterium RIFOXYC2_FULL_50_21]OGJ99703.1 MAG: hypothetical protein A2487_18670 [Candidatus Raymondbacteria b
MAISIADITTQSAHISDGAWGTEFAKLGSLGGMCAEIWNLKKPENVEKVAKSYIDAGSQIILTNSFSGNRFRLKEYNLDSKLKEINMKAVEISKKAAAGKALVFASMGPVGKLVSMGEISEEDAYAAFLEQAQAFKEAGADGVVAETMSDAPEVKQAILAIKKTGLFAVASMSFDSGEHKTHTMMGVSAEDAVTLCTEVNADMIGANCGTGINNFVNICKEFKRLWKKPIWIKGNAGLPEVVEGKTVYKMGPDEFARHALEIVKLGANVVGGCCGTSPAHLAALARVM